MKSHRPKPQSLRPVDPRHRFWLWGFLAGGMIFIALGWWITIHNLLQSEAPQIKETIEQNLDKVTDGVSESVNEAGKSVQSTTDEFSKTYEALKAGYATEKERQIEDSLNESENP